MVNADTARLVEAASMPPAERVQDLAAFFQLFADPTRIRILWTLSEAELCVQDIAQVLLMQQSTVSHQLKILKQARLVRYRREGRRAFYTLDDEHIRRIIDQGMTHVTEGR